MPTKIEWAEETWNPVTGCEPISEGCANCYARRMAETRLRGRCGYSAESPFKPGLEHPSQWDKPARWKSPRMVFVCSMGDLFHDDVQQKHLWMVLTRILASPRHTFLLLTKRPQTMARRLQKWPHWKSGLPNVWLGVTAENQARADERIPILLSIPAAVRFVSIEPLLGPVDFIGWGENRPTPPHQNAPQRWDQYEWPKWVPFKERHHIEKFWSESYKRNPAAWMRDNYRQSTPATGSIVGVLPDRTMGWVCAPNDPRAEVTGRYLHTWNNMGRVVLESGEVRTVAASQGVHYLGKYLHADGKYRKNLHWVICGGETGPGARPMDVEWARNLRDQCQNASVPFFMKKMSGGGAPPADLMIREFPQGGAEK